jgi:hypothetical protein
MEEFRAREDVTEEDIKAREKAEIIMRSVEDIKKRAQEQQEIRTSPQKY